MRSIYVPALLTGIENVTKRCNLPGNKFGLYKNMYDPSWFTDQAIFTHPHVLISYHYCKKYTNYRKQLRVKKDIKIWADSGGYSVATQGFDVNALEALRWQESNSDIAFSLDIPPTTVTKVGRVSPGKNERLGLAEFERNAEISRKNNIVFQENRKREDLLIYNVIHGYNLDTFDLWWDYATDGINFEGYATGAKPTNNMLLQALCLMYLYNKGVRNRIHLLGVSGITVIPVLVWASQYIDNISFDSTSYGYGARTRAYVYPNKIRDYTHFGKKYLTKKKPIKELNCDCPICRDLHTVDYFCLNNTTWPGCLLSLHNLWHTKYYVELLDRTLNMDKDIPKFRNLVHQHVGKNYSEVMYAINFIEHCIHKGFKNAYNIYFDSENFSKKKFTARKIL